MNELPDPEPDGLVTPEVGEWSRDKHHFLWRYLSAFTTAMKDKQWNSLHYIDLFAGAGVEKIRGTNELEWGSPLLAAHARYPFARLHVCEKNRDKAAALSQRLEKIDSPNTAQIINGDANQAVRDILAEIPDGALSLAFLDPFGLHLHFQTVQQLSNKRTDLIIFFADYLDAIRNWRTYSQDEFSNLDLFFGSGADWKKICENSPSDRLADELRSLYERQLKTLGYKHFDSERIATKGHSLYRLIFTSKHKRGQQIWRNVAAMKPDGQRTFDFNS